MEIISRPQWGARHPRGFRPAPLPARELYLHHSVTIAPDLVPPFDDDDQAVRVLEDIGQNRFRGGISYTFAVTPVGRVYEGHGIDREGAHTGGRNSIARAICLVGNYETDRPPESMLQAVAELVAHGHAQGWWPGQLTGGHRDAPGASTACPGGHAHAAIGEINRRAEEITTNGGPMSWDGPPIPDWYREGLPPLPNPATALGWATAHAAHARDRAIEARTHALEAREEAREANRRLGQVLDQLEAMAQQIERKC